MAISGLGFGVDAAVDLALVVDVLPARRDAAKDLGVFNIAGALPFSIAPTIAPAILAIGHGGGGYGVLYMVAGCCAIIGAAAILPVSTERPGLRGPGRVVVQGSDRDVLVGARRAGRVYSSGDRGGPEA